MKAIVLMGIKHCGKSTQGKLLAKKYNVPFYDTDEIMLKQTGKTPREILTVLGNDAFLNAEKKACEFISTEIASSKKIQTKEISAVIATGGGICCNSEALAILKKFSTFVFLFAEECLASERIVREAKISSDGTITDLPAYIAKKSPHSISEVQAIFHSFYVERYSLYSSLADITVQVMDSSKKDNLERIDSAISVALN